MRRWRHGKKHLGLILLSAGLGMLAVLIFRNWAYLLAVVLVVLGLLLLRM
ncbi:MAG: hypothetical protein LBS62_11100 [Clostridiales bacterium]|jgi:hypothetical protein|nr:hypothetical protein [Clostridiales bacterium]